MKSSLRLGPVIADKSLKRLFFKLDRLTESDTIDLAESVPIFVLKVRDTVRIQK